MKIKKILATALVLSIVCGTQVFATTTSNDDTFTGAFLNNVQKKMDNAASPLVNKERAYNAQKKAMQEQNEKQAAARKKQIEERQREQQELINNKRKQIQTQKDMYKQQKNELRNTIN
jgi:uncharacterized protein YaiL (DUF2058 family)